MALERDYEVVATLGEGAFGKVYKATQRSSGDTVAVKQIKLGAKSWQDACRSTELQALKALRHPFIVRLRELLRSPDDGSLYYIFEYVNSDLLRFVKEHPKGATEGKACELTRQLLAGLSYMHQLGFFHRDIKPENILYNAQQGTVRLADFGASRSLRARPPFTEYVGTRWYRAPEALLGCRTYSSPVDIWAAGLVFAELLRGSPLFMGQSTVDQLHRIFQVFGKPDTSPSGEWPELSDLLQAMGVRLRVPPGKGCGLERILGVASAPLQAMLAETLLVLNPRRRASARRCVEHAIFAGCVKHADESSPVGIEERETVTADNVASSRPTSIHSRPDAKQEKVGEDGCEPVTVPTPPPAYTPRPEGQGTLNVDVDIDDELDKILGFDETPANKLGNSKVVLAGTFSPPSRVAHKDAAFQAASKENNVDDLLLNLSMEISTWQDSKEISDPASKATPQTQVMEENSSSWDDSCDENITDVRNHGQVAVPAAEPWSDSDAASEAHSGDKGEPKGATQAPPSEPWSDSEAASEHGEDKETEPPPPPPPGEQRSDREATSDASGAKEVYSSKAVTESWSDSDEESEQAPQEATHPAEAEDWSDSESASEARDCCERGETNELEDVTVVQSVADDPWSDSDEEAAHKTKEELRADTQSQAEGSTGAAPCRKDGSRDLADSWSDAEVEVEPSAAAGRNSGMTKAMALTPGCPQEAWNEEQDLCDGSSIAWDLRCAALPSEGRTRREMDIPEEATAPNGACDVGSSQLGWTTALESDVRRRQLTSDILQGFECRRGGGRRDADERHLAPEPVVASRGESNSSPWSTEELQKLRRAVKRVSIASGIANKEALWQEVSSALGGVRAPRECKAQYTLEYKAHKAAKS